MRPKALANQKTAKFGRRQAGKIARRATVGAAVTHTEKDTILTALEDAGLPDQSNGVRSVMLAFANDKRVREVVLDSLKAA